MTHLPQKFKYLLEIQCLIVPPEFSYNYCNSRGDGFKTSLVFSENEIFAHILTHLSHYNIITQFR